MPTSFLTGIHLRPASLPKDEAARRLGGCLGVLRAHGLEPLSFAAPGWRDATPRVFGGTTLIHPAFAARTGDPLWGAGFMFVPAPSAAAVVITMTTPAAVPEGDAWGWLPGLAEDLCDALRADLALINGFNIKRSGQGVGGTPAGPEVAPGRPPSVLCPWIYFGAERLAADKLTDGLRGLAPVAARSRPSAGGGWVLQAHEGYTAAAPKKLQLAYAETWGLPRVEWLGVP